MGRLAAGDGIHQQLCVIPHRRPNFWPGSRSHFWPCFCLCFMWGLAEALGQPNRLDLLKESIQADISTRTVAITSSFTGTEIIVFGAVANARKQKDNRNTYEIVVVVEGVRTALVLRRKSKVGGMWLNTEAVRFSSVPSYYALASTKPLDEITEPHIMDQHGIGFGHISMVFATGSENNEINDDVRHSLKAAIVRLKRKQGLYVENRFGAVFVGPSLFRTSINLPANVPVGPLIARVHLFRDGILLDTFESTVQLEREGIGRYIYNFALGYPLLYGIFTVLFAAGAGWVTSTYFARRHS